ncbi:hypothetical protein, variant [Sphaeroforma arctica JP610]|uniref:Chromosome transmission fidelity protein 8 n=1 Tax=Sphaeroforma arctica JP610 TaxID=667725 RepID=A0A0L0GCG3_9EUKA|nr:hypothetical protein, variant [Sphaeroforma arctica JP610]KNC86700.1 hypothetical protein, variant [Sphaeroforma arctica JP610]|eukprot:XP_014160602.1 hypothetical protein, variant [Sphaeroforma arctica JP610]
MLLKIQYSDKSRGADGPAEYGMIEIQAEIKSNQLAFDGTQIGDFEILDNGKATLSVGPQKILGKVKDLDTPYAVTKKILGEDGKCIGFEVVAIIRKKFLFVERPIALISRDKIGASTLKKRKAH